MSGPQVVGENDTIALKQLCRSLDIGTLTRVVSKTSVDPHDFRDCIKPGHSVQISRQNALSLSGYSMREAR